MAHRFLLLILMTASLILSPGPSRGLFAANSSQGKKIKLAQNTNSNSSNSEESDEDEDEEEEEEENISIKVPEIPKKNSVSNTQNDSNNGYSEKSGQFQGKLYSWISGGLKNSSNQEFYFNYNRLELKYSQIQGDISFFLKGNARYNTINDNGDKKDNDRRGENLRFDLTEAYINYEKYPGSFLKQVNVLLGMQTINWGKADEVRPTDILSPQDLTLFLLEGRNDRKLGRFTLKSILNFGESLRVEAIWMPIQRKSISTDDAESIFTPASLSKAQNLGYNIEDFNYPEKKLSHSDVALKLYLNLIKIDFSFSFYNGYNPQPFSYINSSAKTITPFLNRVTMWGFDFERTLFWGLVARGELAYFSKGMRFSAFNPDQPALYTKYLNQGFSVEKNYLDATIGLDKNDFLIQKMYFNLQYSFNHIFNFEDGLRSGMGTKLEKTNHRIIWNWYYEWDNLTYHIELGGTYSISHKDYMLNPSFEMKLAIQTKLILGAYLFGGDSNTDMGQFKEKSFGYIQLEHLF